MPLATSAEWLLFALLPEAVRGASPSGAAVLTAQHTANESIIANDAFTLRLPPLT